MAMFVVIKELIASALLFSATELGCSSELIDWFSLGCLVYQHNFDYHRADRLIVQMGCGSNRSLTIDLRAYAGQL